MRKCRPRSEDFRTREPGKCFAPSVISSVIALAKPANGREPQEARSARVASIFIHVSRFFEDLFTLYPGINDDNFSDNSGQFDYETIRALDVDLFNQHLLELMSGRPAQMPSRIQRGPGLRPSPAPT